MRRSKLGSLGGHLARFLVALSAFNLGPASAKSMHDVPFPKGFMWGAATAAHQVEGHLRNDWSDFEKLKGVVANGDTSEEGVDHYNRFDSDFALAADMGHNVHRLSIEWSRIEPEKGKWDAAAVAHYHEVFRSLQRHGIKPMVTLHHFTNPVWVAAQGGWLAEETLMDFERFADFVAREYGGEVDWWITINEPNVYAFQSYDAGIWPPQHKNRDEALQVMANMARAHALAYRALHAADTKDADGDGQAAQVGISQHLAIFDPYNAWNPIDHLYVYFNDQVFNRAMLKAVTTGDLEFGIPGAKGVKARVPEAKSSVDFIGINYYTRWRVTSFGPKDRLATPGAPVNDLGWEIYPEGLYRALKLADGYSRLPDGRRVPIIITENGIDDRKGAVRSSYLVEHLKQVMHAIWDGVDVRGYVHWTLTDNFEWVEGYASRFGLYKIDRRTGRNLERIPTETVSVFKEIATSNRLPEEPAKR